MSFFTKVKDGFNKLIGTPQDPQSAAIVRKVDDCTSPSIVQPDWNLHLQLCQLVNYGDVGCASAMIDLTRYMVACQCWSLSCHDANDKFDLYVSDGSGS